VIRKTAAVWAGKATGALSRITGRGGGTTLPGDVARAIDPHILTKLSQDLTKGSIVITGTNGKTTTARLITWLLEGAGNRVVSNRAGANLIFGATAAALNTAGPDGRLRADWGVFEIDEASLPKAVDEIKPKATLVLNLFRDQLDRYGELESIAKNPAIPAALLLLWESVNGFIPGTLKMASVVFYLQSLCPIEPPPDATIPPMLRALVAPVERVSTFTGIVVLAAVTIAVLIASGHKARKLEINYGTD